MPEMIKARKTLTPKDARLRDVDSSDKTFSNLSPKPENFSATKSIATAETSDVMLDVRRKIEKHLHYPTSTQRKGLRGKVELKLTLNAEGGLENLQVAQSSGSDELDALAILAVHQAVPFEMIPQKKMGKLALSLPIEFKLQSALWR